MPRNTAYQSVDDASQSSSTTPHRRSPARHGWRSRTSARDLALGPRAVPRRLDHLLTMPGHWTRARRNDEDRGHEPPASEETIVRYAALHAAGDVRVDADARPRRRTGGEPGPDHQRGPVRLRPALVRRGRDRRRRARRAPRARSRDGRRGGLGSAGRAQRRSGPRAALRRLPGVRGRAGAPVHADALRRARRHRWRAAGARGLARPAPAPAARRLRPGVRRHAGASRGRGALGGPGAPAARRDGRRGRVRADRPHAGAARRDVGMRGRGRRAARAPACGGGARRCGASAWPRTT